MTTNSPFKLPSTFAYSSLKSTDDLLLIANVLTSDDMQGKIALTFNSNLTVEQVTALSRDVDANVRSWVAMMPDLSSEVLHALVRDEVEDVQAHALSNSDGDPELFWSAVLKGWFSESGKGIFTSSVHASGSLAVFTRLWEESDRLGQHNLVFFLGVALEAHRVLLDTRVIAFVHGKVLSGECAPSTRAAYAGCELLADYEVLDSLKDDSHGDVLYAVVSNRNTWDSTRYHIIDKHPSFQLMTKVARWSDDNVMLNKIYAWSKGEEHGDMICNMAKSNPAFILLP